MRKYLKPQLNEIAIIQNKELAVVFSALSLEGAFGELDSSFVTAFDAVSF